MPLPSDYPCWIYDPTGVNPPMFVKDDPGYVALLNAPLPTTAVAGALPTTVVTAPASVAQPAPPLTQVNGTTQTPIGGWFTRGPQVGKAPAPFFVNATPHVTGKR